MSHPTHHWLLDPTFPATPLLPRLERELQPLAGAAEPSDSTPQRSTKHPPSGTWRVGTHPELDGLGDDERFATSDAEAPTVRPGALHVFKVR